MDVFVQFVGACFGLLSEHSIAGLPIIVWFVIIILFSLIVRFIKGKK